MAETFTGCSNTRSENDKGKQVTVGLHHFIPAEPLNLSHAAGLLLQEFPHLRRSSGESTSWREDIRRFSSGRSPTRWSVSTSMNKKASRSPTTVDFQSTTPEPSA